MDILVKSGLYPNNLSRSIRPKMAKLRNFKILENFNFPFCLDQDFQAHHVINPKSKDYDSIVEMRLKKKLIS